MLGLLLRPALGGLLVLGLSWAALAAPEVPAAREPALPEARSQPGPLVLEDPLEPLVPKEVPDAEQQDRLEALALFSASRLLEQQDRLVEALRLYERAFRYDPKSAATVRAIVPLASQLQRHAEAVRYALKLVELDRTDPLLLNQLGNYLTEIEDWEGAAQLYERALALHAGEDPNPSLVVLHMQMGRLQYLLGKSPQAADCFAVVQAALAEPARHGLDARITHVLLGDAGATYAMMGEAFLKAQRFAEATAAFEKAHEAQPNAALLSYRLARIAGAQQQPAVALEKLQPYLEKHLAEEGLEPYELLADVLRALGREAELVPTLETLAKADPDNVPLGYFLAEQYHQAQQFDRARPLLVALIQRAPAAAGYRSLVDIDRRQQQPEALLDVLGQMVEKTATLDTLGAEALKALLDDTTTVQALLDTARKRMQTRPEQFGLGPSLAAALLAQETKQDTLAGEFFQRAVHSQPERAAALRLSWGLGLLVDDHYAEAAAVFLPGVTERRGKAEERAVFAFYLASALEMQGQTAAALEAARQAVQLQPEEARFQGRVAWVYYHSKQYEQAAQAYQELLKEFDPKYDSPETREAVREARLVLSNLAVLQKDPPQAERWLEEVLDEFPDDVSAKNDLGYLWADGNKNLLRAEEMIQAVVAAEPENAAYRDSLGWVYYRLERFDEAVAELEKASQADADPMISDHLGDAYLAQGHPERARQAWQKALEGFKERQEKDTLQRIQQKLDQSQK